MASDSTGEVAGLSDETGLMWLSRNPDARRAFAYDELCFDIAKMPVWSTRGALQLAHIMAVREEDSYLHVSPMFHSTDLKATALADFTSPFTYDPVTGTTA